MTLEIKTPKEAIELLRAVQEPCRKHCDVARPNGCDDCKAIRQCMEKELADVIEDFIEVLEELPEFEKPMTLEEFLERKSEIKERITYNTVVLSLIYDKHYTTYDPQIKILIEELQEQNSIDRKRMDRLIKAYNSGEVYSWEEVWASVASDEAQEGV